VEIRAPLLGVVLLSACAVGEGAEVASDGLAGGRAAAEPGCADCAPGLGTPEGRTEMSFVDVTEAAGLREPLRCMMGHGAAFGDFNGDGWPDLLFGTFADREPDTYLCEGGPRSDRLFRNLGDGTFAREPNEAIEQFARSSAAVFADLDGDGDLDAVVARNGRLRGGPIRERANELLRNDDGIFVDVSEGSGLQVPGMSARNILPFDYDGDGTLDLFIVEDKFTGKGSKLFRQRPGELVFDDVTAAAGLPTDLLGLGAAVADVDNDGWADLYISDIDLLFRFDPATKRFVHEPSLDRLFTWPRRNDEDWTAGVAFGDLNRDGWLDLVVAHHFGSARDDPVPPRVYLNTTAEAGRIAFEQLDGGLGPIGAKAPHVEIQDMDNDGWPDLYFSVNVDVAGTRMPLVYRHNGSASAPAFTANSLTPTPPEKDRNYGAGGPTADIDRDGRIDMFITDWWPDGASVLYRNTSTAGNYLEVEVRGANPMGIGSKVYVYEPGRLGEADALIGLLEIATGYGYSSGQEAVAHFGLADRDAVDVRVVLPHGAGTIERANIKANQRVTLR